MRLISRIMLAMASLLLLTSPGFAPIGARTVNSGTDARPALWVVKDADTTIYLFGTIHVLKPGVRWFSGPVRKAFERSDSVMLEVLTPDGAEMAQKTAQFAVDPDGPPLREKLSPEVRTRLVALLAGLGMAPAQLDTFQPWFAAVTLSLLPLERLGYSAASGAEALLKDAARQDGKPVAAFESAEEQLGFFAGLPEPTQIAFLNQTIADAEQAEREIGRMVDNWSAGRPDALAEDMNESLTAMPELADALLFQRNRRWARWITTRMDRPGTLFVAVGAGHLAGRGSLIDDLTAAGLKVTRVDRRR